MEQLAIHGGEKCVKKQIPFAGYGADLISHEEEDACIEALRSRIMCRISQRPELSLANKLENEMRDLLHGQFCHAVNSGASAIYAALIGLGIKTNDEVLFGSGGWVSAASSILNVGALPVPVALDESLSLDIEDLKNKINPRTKALIVVHWRGLPCDMDNIMKIAREHGIFVIEDCAQATGGSYKGKMLGTIGDVGCFSLNMHKMITSGEGGLVTCRDPEVFKRVVSFSGMYTNYRLQVEEPNANYIMPLIPMMNLRIPEICAAVALSQLNKMDNILKTLRTLTAELTKALEHIPGICIADRHDIDGECGYSLPLVFKNSDDADFFCNALRAEGVYNVTNYRQSFGGGESKGTIDFVQSQELDLAESGQMGLVTKWRCIVEQGYSFYNVWENMHEDSKKYFENFDYLIEKTKNIVTIKTNILMSIEDTHIIIGAIEKVMNWMRNER